jgi:uncharacterized protein (DUF1778 family)
MERVIVSVKQENLKKVLEALEKEMSPDTALETAIVIFGPSEKVQEMTVRAMSNGATSFSRG